MIISGGRDVEDIESINAVKRSYGQLGSDVYHTAEHGSVRMVITAEKVWAETFRAVKPE